MLGLSDLRSLVYTKRVRQTIHEIHGNLHQMFQTTIFEKKWFLLKFSTTVENVLQCIIKLQVAEFDVTLLFTFESQFADSD